MYTYKDGRVNDDILFSFRRIAVGQLMHLRLNYEKEEEVGF